VIETRKEKFYEAKVTEKITLNIIDKELRIVSLI